MVFSTRRGAKAAMLELRKLSRRMSLTWYRAGVEYRTAWRDVRSSRRYADNLIELMTVMSSILQ